MLPLTLTARRFRVPWETPLLPPCSSLDVLCSHPPHQALPFLSAACQPAASQPAAHHCCPPAAQYCHQPSCPCAVQPRCTCLSPYSTLQALSSPHNAATHGWQHLLVPTSAQSYQPTCRQHAAVFPACTLDHADLPDIPTDLLGLGSEPIDSWEPPGSVMVSADQQPQAVNSEHSSPTAVSAHAFSGTENDTADDMQPYERLAVERSQANGRAVRKRGRPRRYDLPDTFVTAQPGELPAKKRGRGAKPKYLFKTEEESKAHRRHKNRTAALSSYYRHKEEARILKQQQTDLLKERAILQALLDQAVDPGCNADGAEQQLEQTCSQADLKGAGRAEEPHLQS